MLLVRHSLYDNHHKIRDVFKNFIFCNVHESNASSQTRSGQFSQRSPRLCWKYFWTHHCPFSDTSNFKTVHILNLLRKMNHENWLDAELCFIYLPSRLVQFDAIWEKNIFWVCTVHSFLYRNDVGNWTTKNVINWSSLKAEVKYY